MPKCCMDCPERHRACQDTCEKEEYVQFREKMRRKAENREKEREIMGAIHDGAERMHKIYAHFDRSDCAVESVGNERNRQQHCAASKTQADHAGPACITDEREPQNCAEMGSRRGCSEEKEH